MAKSKRQNSDDLLLQALNALKRQSAHEALGLALKAREKNPDDSMTLLTLGRCQLHTHEIGKAEKTYRSLLKLPSSPVSARIEAKIALHDISAALEEAESGLTQKLQNDRIYFFMAIICYHQGFIAHCFYYFMKAIELQFDWDDEDPVNAVISHVLSPLELQDLEQIYVDALERVKQENNWMVNRWVSLELPVSEVLCSGTKVELEQGVKKFLEMLAPHVRARLLQNGKEELEHIIRDFTRDKTDAQFGFQVLNVFNEGKLANVAQLILALELEHLKQFASFIGLTAEFVETSQFRNLITFMPYCIAVDFLVLYMLSDIEKPDLQRQMQPVEPHLMAALIVACLINFYQEMEKYRQNQKPKPIVE